VQIEDEKKITQKNSLIRRGIYKSGAQEKKQQLKNVRSSWEEVVVR